MGLGLQSITTAIQFVSSGGGGGGGSTPIAQTGDALTFITLLLVLLAIAVGCGLFVCTKAKKLSAQSGSSTGVLESLKTKTTIMQKIAIVAAILSLAMGVAMVAQSGPILRAFGSDNSGTVTVVVNEEDGSIVSIDKGQIANDSNGDFYIYETMLTVNDEAKNVEGVNDVTFNIKANEEKIFEGTPSTDPYQQISNEFLVPYKSSCTTSFSLDNITPQTAKALIGKNAYKLTVCPKNVTIVEYDANDADSGTAPDKQRIE